MPLKPFFYSQGKLSIRGRLALVSFLIIAMTAGAVIVNSMALNQLDQSIKSVRSDVAKRHDLLTTLQTVLGYGGAIHHFKNYVLRGEPSSQQVAAEDFSHAISLVDSYHQFSLSSEENQALLAISGTIKQYQEHLELEALRDHQLENIAINDRLVKVDDSAALKGLATLNQELEILRAARSKQSDTYLISSVNTIKTAGVAIFLISVLGLFWVYRSVLGRINSFVAYSEKIKQSPTLTDDSINWDEFGEIASNYQDVITQLAEEKIKAEQSDRSKTAFLATVSHEVRTPMNGVLGLAQILAKTELTGEQRTHLNHLTESGEHMMALLNEVLDFSKIEEDKVGSDATDFAFSTIIGSVQSLYYPLAHQKGLEFYINSDIDESRWYHADKRHLRQIIYNLTNNAIKFTPHGCVEVNFQEWKKGDKTELHIEVRDTGIGIDIETQQRIFEPFEQADISTTRKFGGTGLGLSIVRSLSKMMNGDVGVSSVPGAGARFTVTLEVEAVEVAETVHPVVQSLDYTGLEVLLIEDNQVNILVIQSMLDQLGFNVTVATRGKFGVDLARRHRYDLILMDHHMPEMSGLEATRLIRQISLNEKTVILGCTADAFSETREKMVNAGVDGVISKPIAEREFHECLASFSSRIFVDLKEAVLPLENNKVEKIKRLPPKNLMTKGYVPMGEDFLSNINIDNIMRSLSLTEDLFSVFAVTIIEDSTQLLHKLELAEKNQDSDGVLLYSHTLKGTWRSLAIWPLVRMAETIQNEAQKGNIDPESILHFKEASFAMVEYLETLLNERKVS